MWSVSHLLAAQQALLCTNSCKAVSKQADTPSEGLPTAPSPPASSIDCQLPAHTVGFSLLQALIPGIWVSDGVFPAGAVGHRNRHESPEKAKYIKDSGFPLSTCQLL